MNNKLLHDDIKLIKQQILFKKNYGEVINFMVNQLGLTRKEAEAEYDNLVIVVNGDRKNVRYEYLSCGNVAPQQLKRGRSI